ncbi:hypothetical protein BpHYR1_053092 [Brachionus plicatilis]|uniref:Uncharacterized protein n=1 Tax=Brachionus plicatilis TaxID=10195 RepID=A0A3M7R4H6_BRAPC|nr:hypothetical protein BpHYR1_053092 [Brachionus plicatilis]
MASMSCTLHGHLAHFDFGIDQSSLVTVQHSPKEIHRSCSLDDRQFSSNSLASLVNRGCHTFLLTSLYGSWLATLAISATGVNKKWTSSGAFGS